MAHVIEDKPIACECSKGVALCHFRPCWGTPKQIRYWLDHGVPANRFWLDYITKENGFEVYIVAPSVAGKGGTSMPPMQELIGRCEFLTQDERCELHGKMKPLEGAIACCKRIHTDPLGNHMKIAMLWDTREGERVWHHWEMLIKRGDK